MVHFAHFVHCEGCYPDNHRGFVKSLKIRSCTVDALWMHYNVFLDGLWDVPQCTFMHCKVILDVFSSSNKSNKIYKRINDIFV